MKKEVLAPQINPNDEVVEIIYWHVQNGTFVKSGMDIVDLGTSKATVTIQVHLTVILV